MMHVTRCEDVQERLDEFHDDELTLEQRVAIQSHLQDCVTCSLVAAELADLRHSLREAAWHLPDRDAPEAERLPGCVMERLRVEEQFSFESEIKSLFQDMHLVWAALGATAAMLFCLIGSISVLHAASQERPDSLAGLITFLANPGSNENPVRLDARMLAPRTRVDDAFGASAAGHRRRSVCVVGGCDSRGQDSEPRAARRYAARAAEGASRRAAGHAPAGLAGGV